jgi:hypothetical protein
MANEGPAVAMPLMYLTSRGEANAIEFENLSRHFKVSREVFFEL